MVCSVHPVIANCMKLTAQHTLAAVLLRWNNTDTVCCTVAVFTMNWK